VFISEPTIEEATVLLSSKYGVQATKVSLLGSGKVNRSFLVERSGEDRLVLQFISPVFQKSPALGSNWEAASERLASRGVSCPRIVPSLEGSLLVDCGGLERLLRLSTFQPGEHPAVGDKAEAKACGMALGRVHSALNEPRPLELVPLPRGCEFTNQRLPGKSDFLDFETLYRLHPKLPLIKDFLEKGARLASELPGSPSFQRIFLLRDLVIHGDPKRDNFLGDGKSYSLIDWDTVSYGDPLIDLAELCRSFAVRKEPPLFDEALAREAVSGYLETGLQFPLSHFKQLSAVIRAIALNLGRRYLTDALLENYFRWDEEAYPTRLAQDTERASALFGLADELLTREFELFNLVA
jgi:Ser/Thr protein kinase RdoA (MazF antagonist)